MVKPFVIPLAVVVTCATGSASRAQPIPWDTAKMEAVLRDPMFVPSPRGGQWVEKLNERYPFRRGGFARRVEYQRLLNQEEVGSFAFFRYPGGGNSLQISRVTGARKVDPKANWKTLTKGWDGFVARHWPGIAFRRVEDPGERAFPKTSPLFYSEHVYYSLVQQGVRVATVQLNVHPEDGKIWLVSCSDDRELMRGFVVPPVLSKEQLQKAMCSWATTQLKDGETLDESSGTIGKRSLDFDFAKQSAYTSTRVSFRIKGKRRGATIYARHNDDAGEIEMWTVHPDEEGMVPTK